MRRIAPVCCLALAFASPAFSEARSQVVWPRVYIEDAHTAAVVRHALGGAARRLTEASCQQLFSDFLDEQGRPLHARLQELEQTGPSYLPLVVFLDGSEMPQCRNGNASAFTSQGRRIVYICGRHFERAWFESPTKAEVVLIHETLHTLGLGENPPTSLAITHHVLRRCSRP